MQLGNDLTVAISFEIWVVSGHSFLAVLYVTK